MWLYTMLHSTNLTTLVCVPMMSPSKSSRCWWLRMLVSRFSLSRATQNWAPISSSSLVPIWSPWREHAHQRELNTNIFTQKLLLLYVHMSNTQLQSQKNIPKLQQQATLKKLLWFFRAALEPGDGGATVHLQTPQFPMLERKLCILEHDQIFQLH